MFCITCPETGTDDASGPSTLLRCENVGDGILLFKRLSDP